MSPPSNTPLAPAGNPRRSWQLGLVAVSMLIAGLVALSTRRANEPASATPAAERVQTETPRAEPAVTRPGVSTPEPLVLGSTAPALPSSIASAEAPSTKSHKPVARAKAAQPTRRDLSHELAEPIPPEASRTPGPVPNSVPAADPLDRRF
jgi:hypothetical protein